MSAIRKIHTENAPAAVGPYSQAVEVNGDIKAQADRAMKNIVAVLEAAGTTADKVVKTMCFLADMDDFAAFNEVYAEYFTEKPARSCVAVKSLPKGALCEIEVIAAL